MIVGQEVSTMADVARLFPELRPGASLRWFAFHFADGSINEDWNRAIAARRAGEDVHVMPKSLAAYYKMTRAARSPSR
jgi:hypothetical protein